MNLRRPVDHSSRRLEWATSILIPLWVRILLLVRASPEERFYV
jgi:hypothetical protein